MRTAHAAVLREADAAVRDELARFDLRYGGLHEPAILPSLLLRDRRAQVLNLRLMLAHEDHHSHFRDSADPGVADELRIERQQPLGLFRIAAGGGLPIHQ